MELTVPEYSAMLAKLMMMGVLVDCAVYLKFGRNSLEDTFWRMMYGGLGVYIGCYHIVPACYQ